MRQPRGGERRPAPLINPAANPDSEAAIDSVLQDTDWLPPAHRPDLDSWNLGSLFPNSLLRCYCWLFLSDYYCYRVIVDLDGTSVSKNND